MRFYTAKVNIGGDRNHVIVKDELSPAEIMVLQAIHGQGEVHDIRQMPSQGLDRTPQAIIKAKLDKIYGKSKVGSGDPKRVLPTVLPGWPNVDLPTDLKSAGISPLLVSDDSVSQDVARKGKAQAKAAKAADSAGDGTGEEGSDNILE